MNANLTRRQFACLAGAASLAAPARLAAQSALTIAAVNYPLAYFADRIAGDMAEVLFPVPAGTDPSFWRPGIADIAAFQSADLILLNGASFADWTARTTLPRSRLVQTSDGFGDALIATETVTHSHGDGGEHSHTGTASYVWLDFALAMQQAEAITAALTRVDPGASEAFAENLQALNTDLIALGDEARAIGEMAEGLPMISSHPRYQYFARAYGLELDAVDWDANEPPSEEQWQALERRTEDQSARVFIWEAAPAEDALARMEALGLENAVFPPLANRPANGDFLSEMQSSLAQLRQAVSNAAAP